MIFGFSPTVPGKLGDELGRKCKMSSKEARLPWFSSCCPGLKFVQRCPGLNQRSPGLIRCSGLEHSQHEAVFDSWKDNKYPGDNEIHNVYRSKRKDYRSRLRRFLCQVEADKIEKLCNVVSTDEKLFWKLLKVNVSPHK